MTRRQTKDKLARRRAHGVSQRARARRALLAAQETARTQKKGRSAVESILRRSGYEIRQKTVKARRAGSKTTHTHVIERVHAIPRSARF